MRSTIRRDLPDSSMSLGHTCPIKWTRSTPRLRINKHTPLWFNSSIIQPWRREKLEYPNCPSLVCDSSRNTSSFSHLDRCTIVVPNRSLASTFKSSRARDADRSTSGVRTSSPSSMYETLLLCCRSGIAFEKMDPRSGASKLNRIISYVKTCSTMNLHTD